MKEVPSDPPLKNFLEYDFVDLDISSHFASKCKLSFSGVTHEIVGGDVLGAPHEKRLILNGEMSFMTMDIRTVSIAVWMYGPPRTSAPTVGVLRR